MNYLKMFLVEHISKFKEISNFVKKAKHNLYIFTVKQKT